jgi:hypothetical protein
MRSEVKPQSFVLKSIRLATGWWLVLIYSERKVLLAGCWWLICSERKVLLSGLVADKPNEYGVKDHREY